MMLMALDNDSVAGDDDVDVDADVDTDVDAAMYTKPLTSPKRMT